MTELEVVCKKMWRPVRPNACRLRQGNLAHMSTVPEGHAENERIVMSRRRPPATDAPFDQDAGPPQWVFDADGNQYPIVARTRRNVVIDRHGERIRLKRRNLERDGFDAAGPLVLFVTTYQLPPAA